MPTPEERLLAGEFETIGFSGSRRGPTTRQCAHLWDLLTPLDGSKTLVHGDCIGADAIAHDVAEQLGFWIVLRPCTLERQRANREGNDSYPPKPPLERNRDIVDSCDVLIACPGTTREVRRSGTWATIRYARKIGKPTIILYP